MGTQSSKLKRSRPEDVQGNLVWCVGELSKWEDQASVVKELLVSSISEPTEALQTIAATTSAEAGSSTSAAGAAKAAAEEPTKEAAPIDLSASKHLLYSIDEVLRHGDAESYFKGIPMEKLEEMLNSPTSWFILPPRTESESGGLSSSRVFSLASLVQVQQHAAKLTQHQSFWAKLSDKLRHPWAHKRSQEELYSSESTQTPFNSPEKTTRSSAGSGVTPEGVEPEAERKTVAESPAIEERSPSPPRTTEQGTIETVAPGGVTSEAASSTTAATTTAPTQAASSIAAEERKETSGPKVQPVVASLATVDNQRKCVLAKYLFIHHWFRVMLASAEYSYKTTIRTSQLKKLFRGSKQWELTPALAKVRYEKIYDDSVRSRDRALVYFDRARLVLSWLLRNYELGLASFKVNATIASLTQMRDKLRSQSTDTHSQLATSIRVGQLSECEMLLQWFARRQLQLTLEQQANERDSLSIGAHMLDVDLTGTLTANEVPNLPAKIFTLLDVRKKREINTGDIQQCVSSLTTRLDQLETRLQEIDAENIRLHANLTDTNAGMLERNKLEALRIQTDIEDLAASLSAIYSFFHRALVLHVFAKAVPDLRSIDPASVPMSHLHLSLEEIERQAHINPLEEEMSLGLWHAEPAKVGAEAERRQAARGREREVISRGAGGGVSDKGSRGFFPSVMQKTTGEREKKAAAPAVEEPAPALQRASPPPTATKSAAVDEQKFPSKGQSDESALQGSAVSKGAVDLPVHSESAGVPVLSTTNQSTSGEGIGEKIKSTFGGGGGSTESPVSKESSKLGKEQTIGEKSAESKGVESIGHVGGEKQSLVEKVKSALLSGHDDDGFAMITPAA